ncbi:uncharacterized protein LOC115739301 isoform X3 [Rhodamnia argentea]|uniref:Uncharacterized protein LOC115739301 isoform X3 n=1 Tax=Rhodamnia argentea TaxID=178133 RepID=A0ABM3GSG6_9MYRT|nr:uncharacterized protein LOC115739301 isoform X3 [Rhodamnia argentea]
MCFCWKLLRCFLLHLSLFSSSSSSSSEDMADCSRGESYGSAQEHEDASSGKKYGGLMPKKKPLITKDHARAFFDSADWALGKQGAVMNEESTVPVESLRPKLQRTPHQRLPPRRPACTSGRDGPAD